MILVIVFVVFMFWPVQTTRKRRRADGLSSETAPVARVSVRPVQNQSRRYFFEDQVSLHKMKPDAALLTVGNRCFVLASEGPYIFDSTLLFQENQQKIKVHASSLDRKMKISFHADLN